MKETGKVSRIYNDMKELQLLYNSKFKFVPNYLRIIIGDVYTRDSKKMYVTKILMNQTDNRLFLLYKEDTDNKDIDKCNVLNVYEIWKFYKDYIIFDGDLYTVYYIPEVFFKENDLGEISKLIWYLINNLLDDFINRILNHDTCQVWKRNKLHSIKILMFACIDIKYYKRNLKSYLKNFTTIINKEEIIESAYEIAFTFSDEFLMELFDNKFSSDDSIYYLEIVKTDDKYKKLFDL